MEIIEQISDPTVPIARACAALGVSRATLYRRTSTRVPSPYAMLDAAPSPRRLSDDERAAVIAALHTERFVDQPPPEVFSTLLSEGVYLSSVRTMYRLLAELGENSERRAQRAPIKHVKPSLTVTAPNQVWTWDITKVRGPLPGVFYFLYVIMDLFSRMVVGWMLAEQESGAHARRLFADTLARHGVAPDELTVHMDRGSPMKSKDLANLFAVLCIARSYSRPHVSDDNAFSEAHFKTLKYQPDYPDHFASPTHARGWCQEFFGWFNDEHHHSALAYFTPAEVFYGRVEAVAAQREAALERAHQAHAERFPNGRPVVHRPPAFVCINPIPVAPDDPANDAQNLAAGATRSLTTTRAEASPARGASDQDAIAASVRRAGAAAPSFLAATLSGDGIEDVVDPFTQVLNANYS